MGRPPNKVPSYLHFKASDQAFVRINSRHRHIYLGRYVRQRARRNDRCGAIRQRAASNRLGRTWGSLIAALVVKYDDYAVEYYKKTASQPHRSNESVRQYDR